MNREPIPDLATIRTRIDAIDRDLVQLLNDRAELARQVGRAKAATGAPIFVPHREQEVFARLDELNRGPLPSASLRAIWREVMSASFALERPLTIVHFGQPGAFTSIAARRKFGESVTYLGVESIATVFQEVERGHADYGVVPIENSTDGTITDTIDAFLASRVRIINELHLQVRHHLLSRVPREKIRRIYSRHTAFGQCRHWLATNLPQAELIDLVSTTKAAERASSAEGEAEGAAAIGSKEAGTAFNLATVVSDIQDNPNNLTRFVIIGRPEAAAKPTGNDKTSLMLSIQDQPGALYGALVPFQNAGINLCKIESRPSRRQAWEYHFFIDVLGHHDDPAVAAAITELKGRSGLVEILGSYPRAEAPING